MHILWILMLFPMKTECHKHLHLQAQGKSLSHHCLPGAPWPGKAWQNLGLGAHPPGGLGSNQELEAKEMCPLQPRLSGFPSKPQHLGPITLWGIHGAEHWAKAGGQATGMQMEHGKAEIRAGKGNSGPANQYT